MKPHEGRSEAPSGVPHRVFKGSYCGAGKARGDAPRGLKSELTVFFALVLAFIFALFLGTLESARTQAARLNLTIAANSSIDSLFSQYHRELWEEYRLLGLEQYAYDQLTDEMAEFMKPYFEAGNWLNLEPDTVELTSVTGLTEENGAIFEEEVLNYMQYGIAAVIWDLADIEIFNEGTREGPATEDISDLYDDHAGEAAEIERILAEIASCAGEAAGFVDDAADAAGSHSGSAVIRYLEAAIERLNELPGLVDKYEAKADKLSAGLVSSRTKLENKRSALEISESTYQMLDQDISEYESYILEDGSRRIGILGIKSKASTDIVFLEVMIEKVEDVIRYIDNYEPEDEDDELDEDVLWRPIRRSLLAYDPITISGSYGVEDEEKLGKLEELKELLSGELLKLVLPEGAKISSETLDFGEAPSETAAAAYGESRLTLLERVYVAEYLSAVSGYFGRGVYDDNSPRGAADCETEYIICGLQSDSANLAEVVKRLFAVRSGLNLIYLYSDSTKRTEAKALAMAICGVAALTPLSTVVAFLIMSVWSSAQALMDIKSLLKGGKVPFMHSSDTFGLTIENLLDFAGADQDGDSEKGLTYRQYLKILLFFDMGSELEYRAMDIMQMNIMKKQSDFRMDRLVYSLEAKVNVCAGHVFSELWLVKALAGNGGRNYNMSVSTAYSY